MTENFYNITDVEALKILESDLQKGLTLSEAEKRLEKYGKNELTGKKDINPLTVLLGQFKDFLVWILIGAALVSGFLKEWVSFPLWAVELWKIVLRKRKGNIKATVPAI